MSAIPDDVAVRTHNLTKTFRHVTALDRLNIDVRAGEVVALLGANGSGKSTTFRLLLNIYRPTGGEAYLLGRPAKRLNGDDFKQVSFVSEGQKLPKWMSVEQFLAYCAGFYEDWDDELCKRLVDGFELPEKQKLKHLSRGQMMKCAVASTLPSRPRLLLLDEPFSGLDVETRAQLSHLLRTHAQDAGLATIITTHDVEEVEPVATRLAILSRGKLRIDEPLREYLDRHRFFHYAGMSLSELPEDLRQAIQALPNTTSDGWGYTDSYTEELAQRTLGALPANAKGEFSRMNLRQILTAHAVQL